MIRLDAERLAWTRSRRSSDGRLSIYWGRYATVWEFVVSLSGSDGRWSAALAFARWYVHVFWMVRKGKAVSEVPHDN